jgi:hypothetical protein
VKIFIAIVAALAFGFLLGGVSPRHELALAKKEISTIKSQLAKAKKRDRLDGFTAKMLAGEFKNTNAVAGARQGSARHRGSAASNEPPSFAIGAEGSNTDDRAASRTNRPPMGEIIKRGANLWKIGYDVRRQQVINQARLDENNTAAFDTIIGNLNARLAARVESWAEYIRQKEFMNEEMGARMLNDVSGVIVESYNELQQTMPEEWLADQESREKFEIMHFVNPEIFLPIAGVADSVKP